MARIRTIKPEFWTDEKIVELSFPARLAFIGLWNHADDYGRMEYKPASLKYRIFPADRLDFDKLVRELEAAGMVQVYEANGAQCLQIANFDKHQKVDHRTESKIPAPPVSTESPRIPPNPPLGKEGNGRERKGMVGATAPRFDLFWKAYPKRVGKGAAEKAWAKCAEHHDAILADLSRRKWGDPQFIPYPTTYLNQRRWEDEAADAPRMPTQEEREAADRRAADIAAKARADADKRLDL